MRQQFKKIGKDVIIDALAVIKRPQLVSIGSHVSIDPFFYMTTGASLGSYIHISSHVSVIGGPQGMLIMDDFTTIAAGCRLICASDDFSGGSGLLLPFVPDQFKSKLEVAPIVFQKYSAVATNTIIFPGVTIGEGAVVGAGSIVTKSLEPWTINIGSPTRIVMKRPKDKLLQYGRELLKQL